MQIAVSGSSAISVSELTTFRGSTGTPDGEQAYLTTPSSLVLHPGLMALLVGRSSGSLKPLTSNGERNTYRVTVAGTTVEILIRLIAKAIEGDFAEAVRIAREISPPEGSYRKG